MAEKRRREAGEGSIYRRRDGYWVAQIKVETISGKKTRYRYAKTKKEARQKLREAVAEVSKYGNQIVPDSGSLTLGQYLENWLESHKRKIKQRTYESYEQTIRLHIVPLIGSKKLSKLNPLDVENLYSERLSSGVSEHRVRYIHITLHNALKHAVRLCLIASNPAGAVDPPKPNKGLAKEKQPLTREQVHGLLQAARGDRLEALYVLAVTTGMRQGELLGLQWSDFDHESGTLRVRRTVFKGAVSEPKTKASRRTIKLPQRAVQALIEHRDRVEGEVWIFSTRSGNPISCHNLINRSWRALLDKAGIPYTNFHMLRHSAATLLLEANVHPKHVQHLLGHAQIGTTMDLYTHHTRDMDSRTAQAMDELL